MSAAAAAATTRKGNGPWTTPSNPPPTSHEPIRVLAPWHRVFAAAMITAEQPASSSSPVAASSSSSGGIRNLAAIQAAKIAEAKRLLWSRNAPLASFEDLPTDEQQTATSSSGSSDPDDDDVISFRKRNSSHGITVVVTDHDGTGVAGTNVPPPPPTAEPRFEAQVAAQKFLGSPLDLSVATAAGTGANKPRKSSWTDFFFARSKSPTSMMMASKSGDSAGSGKPRKFSLFPFKFTFKETGSRRESNTELSSSAEMESSSSITDDGGGGGSLSLKPLRDRINSSTSAETVICVPIGKSLDDDDWIEDVQEDKPDTTVVEDRPVRATTATAAVTTTTTVIDPRDIHFPKLAKLPKPTQPYYHYDGSGNNHRSSSCPARAAEDDAAAADGDGGDDDDMDSISCCTTTGTTNTEDNNTETECSQCDSHRRRSHHRRRRHPKVVVQCDCSQSSNGSSHNNYHPGEEDDDGSDAVADAEDNIDDDVAGHGVVSSSYYSNSNELQALVKNDELQEINDPAPVAVVLVVNGKNPKQQQQQPPKPSRISLDINKNDTDDEILRIKVSPIQRPHSIVPVNIGETFEAYLRAEMTATTNGTGDKLKITLPATMVGKQHLGRNRCERKSNPFIWQEFCQKGFKCPLGEKRKRANSCFPEISHSGNQQPNDQDSKGNFFFSGNENRFLHSTATEDDGDEASMASPENLTPITPIKNLNLNADAADDDDDDGGHIGHDQLMVRKTTTVLSGERRRVKIHPTMMIKESTDRSSFECHCSCSLGTATTTTTTSSISSNTTTGTSITNEPSGPGCYETIYSEASITTATETELTSGCPEEEPTKNSNNPNKRKKMKKKKRHQMKMDSVAMEEDRPLVSPAGCDCVCHNTAKMIEDADDGGETTTTVPDLIDDDDDDLYQLSATSTLSSSSTTFSASSSGSSSPSSSASSLSSSAAATTSGRMPTLSSLSSTSS